MQPGTSTPPLGTPELRPAQTPRSFTRATPPSSTRSIPPSAPRSSPPSGGAHPLSGTRTLPPRSSKSIPPGPPQSSYPPPPTASLTPLPPKADFGLMTPARRVVEELLGVLPTDRVVIVHDDANLDVAVAFEHATTERGASAVRLPWGNPGLRPLLGCPPPVLAAIKTATATVLAVTVEDGEYDARYALVTAAGAARTRHVHMIGTGRRAFIASMMASTGRVFDLLQSLRSSMRPSSKLHVRSPAGTQLEIEMAPHLRWFANGHAVVPGQWVNVPFGALIGSPATVNGTYVVDAAISGGIGARAGLLDTRPLRMTIEGGRVRRVECSDLSLKRYVEMFMTEAQNRDRVGLLSLGANLGIREPIGEILHDENMPGLHLSVGDPHSTRTGATWSAYGQLAFASAGLDVDLDGEPLIRRGRYVRFV